MNQAITNRTENNQAITNKLERWRTLPQKHVVNQSKSDRKRTIISKWAIRTPTVKLTCCRKRLLSRTWSHRKSYTVKKYRNFIRQKKKYRTWEFSPDEKNMLVLKVTWCVTKQVTVVTMVTQWKTRAEWEICAEWETRAKWEICAKW